MELKKLILKENLTDKNKMEYNPTVEISDDLYGRKIQKKLYEIVGIFNDIENRYVVAYNVIDVSKLTFKEIRDICNLREIPMDDLDFISISVAKVLYLRNSINDDIYCFNTKEEAVEFVVKELKFEIKTSTIKE